ncbi:hypothetical protein BDV95DRAFT_582906 [Massariosphaeria phaeospora]|uniref:Uncharacterized protein n=1 Tax=Massariosphaeria phaeospora TaxID=100035 RepID=A0A7C8ME51_9PLEO|nr:hypothetical protein BDV95DRAFT_582906 [Massariosphaeria phaeospora]
MGGHKFAAWAVLCYLAQSTWALPGQQMEPIEDGLKCYGLEDQKYVARDPLSKIINDDFCPGFAKLEKLETKEGYSMNMYLQEYNKKTPERVFISIGWNEDISWKPTIDDCKKYFHRILDDCDKRTTGMNWKGGGMIRDNKAAFQIRPMPDFEFGPDRDRRLPAGAGTWGECHINPELGKDVVTVWGYGWLNNDFGHALYLALIGGLEVSAGKWDFRYEKGVEGRKDAEWKVRMETGLLSEGRMEDGIVAAAMHDKWGIDCYRKG